jgi:hypothetical protein
MVANSLLSYMFMNSAEFLTAMAVVYVYELAVTLIAQHFFGKWAAASANTCATSGGRSPTTRNSHWRL